MSSIKQDRQDAVDLDEMNRGKSREVQSEMEYFMPLLVACATQCAVILEIGCGHGNGSTRALAYGQSRSYDSGIHISVDNDPVRPEEEPVSAGWHRVTGDSRDPHTLDAVMKLLNGSTPDLIFIDTVHTKEYLQAELALWYTVADKHTRWLFHDTWMFGCYNPMVEALDEFCAAHPEWQWREMSRESHGMGEMRWRGGL